MFRRRDDVSRSRDEQPHPYRSGFGHKSYCVAMMPSGLHCGRPATDPVHVPDETNPLRRPGSGSIPR